MPRSLLVLLALVSLVAACRAREGEVPTLVLGRSGPSASRAGSDVPPATADDDTIAPTRVPRCVDPVRDLRPVHPANVHRVLRASYPLAKTLYDGLDPHAPEVPALALALGEDEMQLMYLEPAKGIYETDAMVHFEVASKGSGDVALEGKYRLALAYECIDRSAEARALLLQIVQASAHSTLVPYVFFAFGDIYRREGESDPVRYTLAVLAYKKVREFKDSPIAEAAERRLAECEPKLVP